MGRRRRTAYWSSVGGGNVPVQASNISNSHQLETSPLTNTTPATDVPNTRRSLRQQARQAAKVLKVDDDFVDIESSDDDYARFTPLPAPRKKRFLKDVQTATKSGKTEEGPESTAAVLSRLINKRVSKPGYVVKAGRFNLPKNKSKIASRVRNEQNSVSNVGAASSSVHALINESFMQNLPLKVEVRESDGTVTTDGPKKRGRKRKVDLPVNLSMKNEPSDAGMGPSFPSQKKHPQQHQDPDWDPNLNEPRKRGRQSAATANVKNRFPFCTLCLSKTPPSDYIINYMSCPNEYQKMKRLFTYIYKDLRFPFMPFDLERENVFDYCDLPLCDCCIQLYREIYSCYAQIEAARDQVKTKVERMVYQIQLSEQNPAVAQQLNSIKNSPDSLMNKYCNFRRRFVSYRPGDSRCEAQGTNLVPATIARVTVINQTPKRTTGSQTFLTAGEFPATTPKVPETSNVSGGNKGTVSGVNTSNGTPNANVSSSNGGSSGVVIVKKEAGAETSNSSAKKPQNVETKSGTATVANVPKIPSPHKQLPPKPTQSVQPKVTPSVAKPSTPTPSARPVPHTSVLTIIKSPGGGGPAIIRKVPVKPSNNIIGQPAKLLAIATPTHKKNITKSNVNGSSDQDNKSKPQSAGNLPSSVVVKDEPVDVDKTVDAVEETDLFFSSDMSAEPSGNNPVTSQETVKEKDGSKSVEESDTNVFHKHKKLRVLPIPSYKESSNDSSDNTVATTNNDDNNDLEKKSENNVGEATEVETLPSEKSHHKEGTEETGDNGGVAVDDKKEEISQQHKE